MFVDPLSEDARYFERRSSVLPAGTVTLGGVGTAGAGGGLTVPLVPTAPGVDCSTATRATSLCLEDWIPHHSSPPIPSAASSAASGNDQLSRFSRHDAVSPTAAYVGSCLRTIPGI